jgi:cytochrome c oxidase subunit 2
MRADMERGRDASLRPTVMRAVVLGAIASIIGIVVALAINWFPPAASKQADRIDTLWDVLLICSIPIFVLVSTVVVVSVIKFRMRPGEEELDGPPIHGNTRLEVIWTAIPATLLIALCAYAYIVLHDIEKAPAAQELNVKVTGQQFTWTFEYRGTNGKTFTVPQLFVPEGQSVRFNIVSKDVLHDFWVPAFRMKIDAVPGIVTHYRVTPTETGTFPVVCAELCGLGHAFMRQTAHVLPRRAQWRCERRGRQAGLRRQRLRGVPHAGRCRRHGHHRAGPRQVPLDAECCVHQAVDRRPRRLRREGVPERHHAAGFRHEDQGR